MPVLLNLKWVGVEFYSNLRISVSSAIAPASVGVASRLPRLCLPRPAELDYVPVEDVVVGESLDVKEVAEELPQVAVVGLLLEPQGPAVVQVGGELAGGALA